MPKCPNCGRETQRTKDWACQWCGYPLQSGRYKTIDKTWKQIKEERREAQPSSYVEPAGKSANIEETLPIAPEITSQPEKQPAPSPRPVKKESIPAPETEKIAEPEVVVKPEIMHQPAPAPQTGPSAEVEAPVPGLDTAPETAGATEPLIKGEPETAPPPPAPEPVVENALALTVDELLSAYMVDDNAAHEKFTNKILSVTGVVNRVAVNDVRAVYSIFLTGREIAGFRDVECRFTRQHATMISTLKAGQSVTIQGRYFGYVINIILRNCVLVS